MSLFTLFEYGADLRKSRRAGFAQDLADSGLNPANSGRWATSGRIDCGHVSSAISAALIGSRLRLRLAIERRFALAQHRRAAFALIDSQTGPHRRMINGER